MSKTPSPWSSPKRELHGTLASIPSCPKCGETLDGYTSTELDGAQPKPGDVSVCFYCGTVLVFTNDLKLAPPDPIDAAILAVDRRVTRARTAVVHAKEKRDGNPTLRRR